MKTSEHQLRLSNPGRMSVHSPTAGLRFSLFTVQLFMSVSQDPLCIFTPPIVSKVLGKVSSSGHLAQGNWCRVNNNFLLQAWWGVCSMYSNIYLL